VTGADNAEGPRDPPVHPANLRALPAAADGLRCPIISKLCCSTPRSRKVARNWTLEPEHFPAIVDQAGLELPRDKRCPWQRTFKISVLGARLRIGQ
jgi:hypothetical protein